MAEMESAGSLLRRASVVMRRDVEQHPFPERQLPATLRAVAGLLDSLAVDADSVDRQNARTAERAERTGGDGHTWVMHHSSIGPAIEAARAYLRGAE